MKLQLIRNATMKIHYAGKTILTDPMFSKKGEIESFAGIEKNPTVELPFEIKQIIEDVDTVLVSHNHPDHLDQSALENISKDINIICQPNDNEVVTNAGFKKVYALNEKIKLDDLEVIRTEGQHGKGKILDMMGKVSGFVLKSENEPTVYWIGDSILYEEVEKNIKKYKPEIIITHSGGAIIPGFDPILMNAEDTLKIFEISPNSKVVAVHLESLDHCPVKREQLKNLTEENSINSAALLIPENGEIIEF